MKNFYSLVRQPRLRNLSPPLKAPSLLSTGATAIILLSTFLVIRWMRASGSLKYRRGGLMNPGGVDSTMFHQQVAALKTRLLFGAV